MRRHQESVEDTLALVIGGPLFAIVAGFTAVVMAVGFVAMETVNRILHR